MKYNKNFNEINEILAEWNPIGVPSEISKEEYSRYVLNLFKYQNDYIALVKYMEFILTEEIGLNYDCNKIDDKKEILFYAYKIFEAFNK